MTVARGRGRPKLLSKGLTTDQWLRAYLSAGSRPVEEIREVARLNDFGWRTVERAKEALGIKAKRVLHAWHWKDLSVPDPNPKPPDTSQDVAALKQQVKELTRLSQSPQASQTYDEDGPAYIDPNAADGDGYLTHSPGALGLITSIEDATVTPIDIIRRTKERLNEGRSFDDITREVFKWAYPAAGLSESVLKGMLTANHVKVGPKHVVFGPVGSKPNAVQNAKAASSEVSF